MKTINNNENQAILTASKVANLLDISVVTLTNWYAWYNNEDIEKPEGIPTLPPYSQNSVRGPRLWKVEDIDKLKTFKEWVPKGRGGVMGVQSSKYWGDRSKPSQN